MATTGNHSYTSNMGRHKIATALIGFMQQVFRLFGHDFNSD